MSAKPVRNWHCPWEWPAPAAQHGDAGEPETVFRGRKIPRLEVQAGRLSRMLLREARDVALTPEGLKAFAGRVEEVENLRRKRRRAWQDWQEKKKDAPVSTRPKPAEELTPAEIVSATIEYLCAAGRGEWMELCKLVKAALAAGAGAGPAGAGSAGRAVGGQALVEVSPPPVSSKLAKALALLVDHPDWSTRQIAVRAGCSRSHLAHSPTFVRARAAQRRDPMKVHRDARTGRLEVEDEGRHE